MLRDQDGESKLPSQHARTLRAASCDHFSMTSGFWARLRRYYLAGLLVFAPTALTLWVAWKFFTFFDGILGDELRARGVSVFGLGFVLLNVLLLLLGFLTTNFVGRRLFHLWDALMHRVPLVNKIY